MIISACVMGRQKPLLARQFVEVPRVRIEALLNAFLKLVQHAGTDHTYVESDCVRYVYQPLESLYLVLVTTKQSNILEDLHTLRVFSTIVQDACSAEGLSGGVDVEQVILDNVFTILFMLDELVSFGLREAVTLSQLRAYKDMDSNEEKLQKILTENKEKEEKERRRQIALRLDKERAALNKSKQRMQLGGLGGEAAASSITGGFPTDASLLLGAGGIAAGVVAAAAGELLSGASAAAGGGDSAGGRGAGGGAAAGGAYGDYYYGGGDSSSGGDVLVIDSSGSNRSSGPPSLTLSPTLAVPPGGRGMQLGPQPQQQQQRRQLQQQQQQQQASLAAALLLPAAAAAGIIADGDAAAAAAASMTGTGLEIGAGAPGGGGAGAAGGGAGAPAAAGGLSAAQDAVRALAAVAGAASAADVGAAAVMNNPLAEPVQALLEEKVKGTLHAEGGVEELDVQGTFFVTVLDPARAGLATFKVSPEDNRFRIKVHPNLNKNSYQQNNILELRDTSRAYTASTPVAILKWRLQTKDESFCPLAISCWSAATPGGVALTVEVEAAETSNDCLVENVHFSFTCPGNISHKILRVESGSVEHDGCSLHWRLPQMRSGSSSSSSGGSGRNGEKTVPSSATLEFFATTDLKTLLPFSVEFFTTQSLCAIDVFECFHMTKKESIPYTLSRRTDYSVTVHS